MPGRVLTEAGSSFIVVETAAKELGAEVRCKVTERFGVHVFSCEMGRCGVRVQLETG
jgi:hypothetical protein